jgi:hypothetical protein
MGPRCGRQRTGAARVNGFRRDPKRKKIDLGQFSLAFWVETPLTPQRREPDVDRNIEDPFRWLVTRKGS